MIIDLLGPGGNAYAVMGVAQAEMRRQSVSQHEIDIIMVDAMSGDYEHLLDVIADNIDVEYWGRKETA